MVEDEKVQSIMLSRVGEGYAGGAYWVRESQMQNEIRVIGVGFLANIGSADAQNEVVFQDPP